MPIYIYSHPETGEYVEVVQSMNEDHVYIDDQGVKWNREWTVPQACVKDNIDPFSKNDFVHKTKHKKGTMGDLMDQSRELSEKREKSIGSDKVKDQYFKDYSKKRNGKLHWDDPKLKPKSSNGTASID